MLRKIINRNSMHIMKNSFIALTLILLCVFQYACSRTNEFLTPEATYERLYEAIQKKDLKDYISCFHKESKMYSVSNLNTLAPYAFNKMIVKKHTVLKRENVSNDQVILTVEETVERVINKPVTMKSLIEIKFMRDGKKWKIYSSKILKTEMAPSGNETP